MLWRRSVNTSSTAPDAGSERESAEEGSPPLPRHLALPRRTTPGRLFYALLIAGMIPGAFLGLIGAAESGLLRRPHEALLGIAAFALILFYFMLPALICLGLPLAWLLRRLARESWWAFALGGALAALVWTAAIYTPPGLISGDGEMLKLVLAIALPGALAGLGFWLTAFLRGSSSPRRRRVPPAEVA